jgi:hypothetical protein
VIRYMLPRLVALLVADACGIGLAVLAGWRNPVAAAAIINGVVATLVWSKILWHTRWMQEQRCCWRVRMLRLRG